MTTFGIPFTGNRSAIGFTLGFIKGWYERERVEPIEQILLSIDFILL